MATEPVPEFSMDEGDHEDRVPTSNDRWQLLYDSADWCGADRWHLWHSPTLDGPMGHAALEADPVAAAALATGHLQHAQHEE